MKYEIGDKVKIKTWAEMEEEYGLDTYNNINCSPSFVIQMEYMLNRDYPDRIIIIKDIVANCYRIADAGWSWSDDMINEKITNEEIKSRIIRSLLLGKKIPSYIMTEVHHELVNKGFANFSDEEMRKNWKTDYWKPEPSVPYVEPEPITSRFDILDL